MKFSPLRSQLLQLAISGKLTEQLDSEPEVAQLGSAPAPEEVPFALPPKWKWVQIGSLLPFGDASNQVKPEQIPANSWLLGLEEIASGGDLIKKFRDWDSVGSTKNAFKAGDVLYSKMRPYLNKVIIADEPGFCSTELIVLDAKQAKAPLLSSYLLYFLRTPYFVNYATTHSHGQKPRLDLKLGKQAWMPLPPLDEQRRIVAIVDELMSTLDRIEEAYGEFEGPMTEHFRNSALQQAMQGQLVPQLDTEPEVAQLGSAPAPDEVPFAIPSKWKWVQLGMLCDDSFSGGTPSKANSAYWGGDIPWASIKDISPAAEELWATKDHITQSGLDQSSSKLVETGNVIVGMRMGLDRVVINQVPVAINQDLRALYLKRNLILPKYFVKFYQTLKFEGAGTTVKGIKASQLLATLVPLPPLEEQRRIVAKLEELFIGVEQLKSLIEFA